MTKTLAICDLNAAVAARDKSGKWENSTCLLAQFVLRNYGPHQGISYVSASLIDGKILDVFNAVNLVKDFDVATKTGQEVNHEDTLRIAKIRRQLPLELEVSFS